VFKVDGLKSKMQATFAVTTCYDCPIRSYFSNYGDRCNLLVKMGIKSEGDLSSTVSDLMAVCPLKNETANVLLAFSGKR